MTRTKIRPDLPELERLPQIFTVSQIEEIANKAFKPAFRKRNRRLDMDILRAGIIEAASAYVLAVAAPSRGEIKREIERILKLTKSNRNVALAYALRRLSQQAMSSSNRATVDRYRGSFRIPSQKDLSGRRSKSSYFAHQVLMAMAIIYPLSH